MPVQKNNKTDSKPVDTPQNPDEEVLEDDIEETKKIIDAVKIEDTPEEDEEQDIDEELDEEVLEALKMKKKKKDNESNVDYIPELERDEEDEI
jgi:hypothetical protein